MSLEFIDSSDINYPYSIYLNNSFDYYEDSSLTLLNKKRHHDLNEYGNFDINHIKNDLNNNDDSINEEDKNKIYYNQNVKTEEISVNKNIKLKRKIFNHKKINKNLGRRKKNAVYSSETKNNKYKKGNIIQVIKTHFINHILHFINKKISLYGKKKMLKKTKPNFVKANNKTEDRQYLSKKISEIFSDDLSDKCSKFKNEKDFNKKLIKKIIKENKAKEVIEIFNTTLQEMYEKYISNEITDFCLNVDLDEIKKKNEKEYVECFENNAKMLIQILNEKGRAKRKKK